MKNHTVKSNIGHAASAAAAVTLALFATGCIVTSVYPYYTEKDLVFEPALLGDWVGEKEADQKPAEFMSVERLGDMGYRATAFGSDQTNSVICHLFRLKKQLFLDTCPTNHSLELIPVHQVSKVTMLQTTIETANLKYKWLEELVKQHPKTIRHARVRDEESQMGNEKDLRIVLTASTAELQKFILKHLNNTNAWDEPSRSKRRR